MKKLVVFLIVGILVIFCGCYKQSSVYAEIENEFINLMEVTMGDFKIYDSSEITTEVLENRNGMILIERCIGTVDNGQTGAGTVTNSDDDYNYIGYEPERFDDGNTILTYLVYNPENNYIDDIMDRYDFVISNGGVAL